jgi:hypothetical protein
MREYRRAHPEKWTRTREQRDRRNAARRKRYAEDPEYRERARAHTKRWQEKNAHKRKAQRLSKYGITLEQYEDMLSKQGHQCAICGHSDTSERNTFPLVDHCHKTNEVRGILCIRCNQGLGQFRDDPTLLQRAVDYLGGVWANGATR